MLAPGIAILQLGSYNVLPDHDLDGGLHATQIQVGDKPSNLQWMKYISLYQNIYAKSLVNWEM